MKTNNKILKLLSIILALSIVSPSIVNASSSITKEETVYVNLNNDGKVNDKLSSIWIHSDSEIDKIVDKSILKDIVNIKDDTEPDKKANELIWDVKDSDIYYQGTPNKELPIETNIKYYLEDKEVDPNDIIGKDGKLKIKIQIENVDKQSAKLKNNKNKTVYTPYIVATVVDLPTDKFSNININTGKLISDGSRQIVSHISLPGLRESLDIEKELKIIEDDLEITADVVDFEMESIMFAATSEFPDIDSLDSAEDLDELLDGLDKLEEASDKLIEATGKLSDGQKELDTGIGKLVDGTHEINLGSNELLNGSNQLRDGINSAHNGSKKINQGTNTLANSADELGQGFADLGDGTIEFSNKAAEFSQATSQLSKGLSSIPESTKALEKGMNDLISSTETIQNGQEELTKGLNRSTSALKEIKAGKEKESKIISLLLKGTNGLDTIANGIEKVPGGESLAIKMKEVLNEQRIALEGIQGSSNEIIAALNQVEEGLKEAETASNQLSQGTKDVNDGQKKVNSGLTELANGTSALKDASDQLSKGSVGLKDGANKINKNAKLAQSGASQFTAGSKDLSNATNDLSNGLGELNNGSGELNKGISQLNKGTKELSNGGKELKDGSSQLLDGTKELNKGMHQFNDEGISKISEELNNSDLNIEDIIETKDELVELSKENDSFSGISKDMEGKLKFIMKTESIKDEEVEEVIEDDIEETEESKGFISWIKGIFNRDTNS